MLKKQNLLKPTTPLATKIAKAILLSCAVALVCLLVLASVLHQDIHRTEDWSYLDYTAISGYENGSFVNGGEYYSDDVVGSRLLPVSKEVATASTTSGGTAAAADSVSSVVASKDLSSTVFSSSNVAYARYWTGNNPNGSLNVGTGKFGFTGADIRQNTALNTVYSYVQLTDDMLALAKTGKLIVTMSGTAGAAEGYDQDVYYGFTYNSSPTTPTAFDSLSAFSSAMLSTKSSSFDDIETDDFSGITATIPANNYSSGYIIIGVCARSEYGSFIGGRYPSGYLCNLTLSFSLGSCSFNTNTTTGGCSVTASSSIFDSITGSASSTAVEGNGYRFINWTKGTTSTQISTNKTLAVTVANDFKNYQSYKANFNAINYVVTFNANGQTFSSTVSNINVSGINATSDLPTASSTDSAMRFVGWMYSASGSSVDLSSGQTFYPYTRSSSKNATVTITLYALWQAAQATGSGLQITNTSPAAYSMYEDITYTISATNEGYNLAGVYATYTSGDLNGEKIALTKISNTQWKLYGICGNCTLTAEWTAITYSITWQLNSGTLSTKPSTGTYNVGIQSGVLKTYVPTRSGYAFTGWTVTGTRANGNSYTESYIPSNAISATCSANWVANSGTYQADRDSTYTYSVSTASDNSAIARMGKTYSHNYDWFDTPLTPDCNGITGALGYGAKPKLDNKNIDYYAYVPVYITGALRSKLSQGLVTVSVTATATLKVGAGDGDDPWIGSDRTAQTFASISIWSGASTSVSVSLASNGYTSTNSTYNTTNKSSDISTSRINSSGWASTTSASRTTGSLSLSSSDTAFTIGFKTTFSNNGWANACKHYGYFADLTYKVTVTANNPTIYKTTLNPNGGKFSNNSTSNITYETSSASWLNPATTPYVYRDNYSFVGWGTSAGATSAITSFSGTTSGTTYYAIWTPNKYPLITYDVYTDGTIDASGLLYATRIRKERYVIYGTAEGFNGNDTSHNTYENNATNRDTSYPYADIGDYGGFTTGNSYTYRLTTPPSHSNTWEYTRNYSKSQESSVSAGNVTGPVWGFYLWNLSAPTATATNPTTTYGTAVTLTNYITPNHGDSSPVYTYSNWQHGQTNAPITFYVAGEPTIYTVPESHSYVCTLTVTVTRLGVNFSKSSGIVGPTVTINPIKLKLNAPTTTTLTYNGTVRDFAFTTTVDSQYTGATYTAVNDTFTKERDLSPGTGQPWYYRADGNNTGYWCGVSVLQVALGYTSALGNSYYTQATPVFRDAGTYWVNTIHLRRYLGTTQGEFNANYVWGDTSSPELNANAYNASGTVSATITAKNGFDLYAFYTYKTFGSVADPVKHAVNMSDGDYDFSDYAGEEQTAWYLGISGLLDVDFETYSAGLANALTRDTSGAMPQSAGTYDVSITLNSTSFPARLLNNYGCRVGAADYTSLTTSTIRMYFYDKIEEGDAAAVTLSNTPYTFTASPTWANYSQDHDNFVIIPREVNMSYSGDTSFTYDGDPHGLTNVVTDGLLGAEEQAQFANTYGVFFNLYFYGIPMPSNWASIDKAAYVAAHRNEKVIVGSGNRIHVTGISDNYIQFLETHAGSYGVIVVDTAYSTTGNGQNFAPNPNYCITGYYPFAWTISKRTVDAPTAVTSQYFGDIDFGGTGFTFSNIVAGDAITCTVATTYNGGSSSGFIRYNGLTSSTQITNGTYRVYGTHVGTYQTTISAPATVGSTTSSGLYGASDGNDYAFSSNYTSTRTVTFRTVDKTITYTTDGGSNFANSKPAASNWIYQFGVNKGVHIVISNFYDVGFATSDISAQYAYTYVGSPVAGSLGSYYEITSYGQTHDTILQAGKTYFTKAGDVYTAVASPNVLNIGTYYEPRTYAQTSDGSIVGGKRYYTVAQKSAGELAKIPILSTTLLNPASLNITHPTTGDFVSIAPVQSTDGNGSVTYSYYGVNAGSYTVSFAATGSIHYSYNSTLYENYHLNEAINASFSITPKQLTLTWKLDNVTQNALNPSVTYNASSHTVAASLTRATNGSTTNNDGKVYYGDWSSATALYTTYSTPLNSRTPTSLSYTGTRTATNANGYTAYVTQLSGNYVIKNHDPNAPQDADERAFTWTIARRTFTMSVDTGVGTSYLYDGTQKTATLTLNGGGVTVVIDDFSTSVVGAAGAHFTKTAGLDFNASTKSFGATNVGRYEFSYDAGSGIDVETNWRLTGSATYTSSTTYLFVIVPKVITLVWNTTALTYNGSNRVRGFDPAYGDALSHTGETLTYSLSNITHAGSYTQSVTATSGNSNFVLAAAGLSSQWYATYNTNERLAYYTTNCVANGNAISTYSQSVTVNPYTITLDTAALNALIAANTVTYDGAQHGFNLSTVYDGIKSNLLTAADRTGYSLAGTSQLGTNAGTYNVQVTGFNAYNGHIDYVLAETYSSTWSILRRTLNFYYTEYHEYYAVTSPTGNPHTSNYYEKSYVLSTDVIDSTGKTYYTYSAGVYTPVADPSNQNPSALGYYEEVFSLSEDTSVNGAKTYYAIGTFAGNPPTISYDGLKHGFYLLIDGMVVGEKITLNFSHSNTNLGERTSFKVSASGASVLFGVQANTYTFLISSLTNATVDSTTYLASNYQLGSGTDKTWVIEQRTIAVTWHNTSVTYRASEYNPSNGGCYATISNLVGSDVIGTLTYGGTYYATNAGNNYPISITAISGGDSANYQIVGSLSTTWTINKKTVSSLTWAGQGFAGLSVTYDNTEHTVVATPTSGATAANDGKVYASDAASFAFTYSSTLPSVASAVVVGNYKRTITGCNNANYVVSAGGSATADWSITAKTLTVSVTYDDSTDTHTYDAALHGLTILISGYVADDYNDSRIAFSFTTTAASDNGGTTPTSTSYSRIFRSTNYGTYTASVSITGGSSLENRSGCYSLSGTTSGTFYISKRAVTLTWTLSGEGIDDFSAVYDGTQKAMTATVSNKASESDVVTISSYTDNTATNVGSYTAVATAVSNTNYTITGGSNLSHAYSITARPITVSWTNNDYTYTGAYQGDTLTIGNLIAKDALTFTVNFYTGGYSGTNIHTSTITKAAGSGTAVVNNNTFTASSFAATIDAGTYYVILSTVIKTGEVVNANYSYTPAADNDRTNYEIARKTLALSGTWTWTNGVNSGTYNNETYLIYNTAAYTLTTSIAGGSACTRSDTGVADSLTLTYSGNSMTHAGTSTATVSGITGTYAANYQLPAVRTKDFTVHAKEVAIVWSNYSGIVYDGNNHTITASIASGASTNSDGKAYTGDTVTVATLSNDTKSAAGNYTSVASALSNSDYVIGTGAYCSGNATLNWSISPRPVSLAWSATNIEYDGTAKTVNVSTVTNLVSGDTLTFTYSNHSNTAVGDYTATVTSLGGDSASNYTLTGGTNVSHVWHITPILLNFSWSGGANLTYDKTAQGVTLTIGNIAASDLTAAKLSFTYGSGVTATHTPASRAITFTAINAGSYTASVLTITGTSAGNYSLPDSGTSQAFTIAQRVITVSWTYSNVTYDSASHNAVASVTNLCAGDSTTLTYRTTGTGYNVLGAAGTGNVATHAGSYTTSITAVANANYTISGATGLSQSWTISPKALTAFTYLFAGGNPATPITYDGTAKSVTATVASAATATNDGKTYTGDSVTLSYSGSVRTDYGISSISGNTATNAGVYRVTISSTGNNDYSVTSQYVDVTISKRTLTVTVTNVTSSSYVYDGTQQGKRVTLDNIIAGDNDNTNLNISPTFAAGTVTTATRSGTSLYRDFLATNADSYSGTGVLSGNRAGNYQTASAISVSFTISPKEINTAIVANTTTNTFTYAARAIAASDLGISFTTLVGGETLGAGTDFNVTYKQGSTPIAAPSNVGSYKAVISLAGTTTANNYTLVGTTEFEFSIVKYLITSSMLTWKIGNNTVTLNGMVYAADTNRTITLTVSDAVYATNSKTLSYQYFGFCNGALNQTYAEFQADPDHATHQWLLDNGNLRTTGPVHAGTYWVVVTLSGGDAANFQFDTDYFTGYADPTHFTTSAGSTYLTWYNDSSNHAIASALPVLGDNVACITFGINRAALGAEVAATPSSLPYKGAYYRTGAHYKTTEAFSASRTYYTGVFNTVSVPDADFLSTYYELDNGSYVLTEDTSVDAGKTYYTGTFTIVANPVAGDVGTYYEYYGLPYINAKASGAEIWVEIDSTLYTYAAYKSSNLVKNAGTYNIRIYDANAGGAGTVYGCDFFSDGAVFESVTALTVTKSNITVTDQRTSANAWQKKYDKALDFPAVVNPGTPSEETIWSYPTGVTFVDGAISDGVLSGTTATISAAYSNFNAGARTLTFTLSGADAGNYKISFATSNSTVDEEDVTVDGNMYSIAGYINQRVITVVDSSAEKVYDGTTALVPFEIDSSDILPSDEGTVTVQGYFASANVGTNIGITITIVNDTNNNYALAGMSLSATGSITAKPVSFNWVNTGNVTYDRSAHGVTVTVVGMVSGHEEVINVTGGGGISNTTIAAGTTSASYSATNAGTYSVSLSLAQGGSSNYSIAAATTFAQWTIAQKEVSITWTKDTLADGAYVYDWSSYSVVYSAEERSVTPSVTGIISGDTVTYTTSQTDATNVGDYSSAVTALTGANAANYVLPSTTSQAWSITAATIEGVTMSNISGVYNAAPQGPEVNRYTTQHGIALNATYSGGTGKTANTIVGNNAITNVGSETISVSLSAANYTTLNLSATVTVTQATVTGVFMNNVNTTFDKTTKTVAVNKTTTQFSDIDSSVISVVYTISDDNETFVSGNSKTNAGTYYVRAACSVAGGNYASFNLSATLVIDKATILASRITVVQDFGTITYDAAYHGVVITVTDNLTQYNDPVTITYHGGQTGGQAKDVGTYSINAVVSAGANYYDFTTEYSTLTINTKNVTLSYENVTFIYNGYDQTPTVTIASGVCAADLSTVALSSLGIVGQTGEATGDTVIHDAGTYRLTPVLNNSNYSIPAGDGSSYKDYTVNQATISGYYFVGTGVYYNGNYRYLGVNSDNTSLLSNVTSVALLASDVGTVSYKYNTTAIDDPYTTVFTGAKYAGTYYIQATISLNGNYTSWVRTATLTINSVSLSGFSLNDLVTTFDGSVKTLAVTVDNESQYVGGVYYSSQGDVLNLSYTISSAPGNSKTNAGTYPVVLTFDPAGNDADASYVSASLTLTATLTINKASLSGINFAGGSFVYDGNSHNVTPSVATPGEGYPRYSLNGAKTQLTVVLSASHNGGSGDIFTVTQTVDEGVSAINVGTYNFRLGITWLSGTSADNYVTYAGLNTTVTITRATMSTSAGDALVQNTNIYFGNGALEFDYDALTHYLIVADTAVGSTLTTNSAQVLTSYTVYPSTNTAHSDVVDIVYTVNTVSGSGFINVGSYTVTATLQNGNYNSVAMTASVTINPADIDYYFVGNAGLTYDTATHYAAVNSSNAYLNNGTVTQIDLLGSDKATVAYTYTSTRNGSGAFSGATNADTYNVTATISVSGGAGGNYNTWETNNSKTVTLVIAPFETSIDWVIPNVTFTYNGLDRSSVITASFSAANSATTPMTITYSGTSGKANGDTIFKNAGDYTVTASYGDDVTSYNYTYTNSTTQSLTMNLAPVALYLVGSSVTYDGVTKYLAVNTVESANVVTSNITSYNPFNVVGEDIPITYTYAKAGGTYDSYYDGESTVTLTTGARNAGSYTITANIDLSGLGYNAGTDVNNSNFMVWNSAKTAVLTISKITLTQSGGTFTKEYDGTTTIADFGTISGIITADTTYLTITGSYDTRTVGTGKSIVFSLSALTNYEYLRANYILPTSLTGTITARTLSVNNTLLYWQKDYDGTTSSARNPLSITTSNRLIEGDNITVNAVYNSKNVLAANEVSFVITGSDATNYSLASLDFSESVDFDEVYLINPLTADIRWSASETDYNGTVQALTATVDVYGEDAVGTNGSLSLTLSLSRTYDGNGTLLSPAETGVTYRNAGTYEATASSGEIDADFIANYGITSTSETFVIHKATRAVNWSGLSASYTYNGTNQGTGITATVTLLGTDVQTYAETDYLTVSITKGGVASVFRNAGDYALTASLTIAILNNNYTLSNQYYERTIQKADIETITFSGEYSWTYYSGVTNYFFVVAAGGTYARYDTGDFSLTTTFYYPYDDSDEMTIVYAGGEVSHASVPGNNGVKNAGSYTVSASIAATENYNSWSGSVSISVSKGVIDNIVMGDVAATYNGVYYYLYAYNGRVGDGSASHSSFSQLYTPDGEEVNVDYQIVNNEYRYAGYSVAYSHDYNYAMNAGIYAVGGFIRNHSNYVDYTVPNVVSSSGTGAILSIEQRDVAVTWEYNNQAVADYTYNATNQASSVRARIIRVEGGAHNYYLSIAFALDEDIDVAAALQTVFVVAGNYDLTASIPNSTQEEIAEYPLVRNNYNMTGYEVSVEMKKFIVSIQWHYLVNHAGGDPEVYDPEDPCVYDKTTHGVTAIGLGLNDVEMTIDTSGDFTAVNAGNYTALVDSIHEGTDALVLNATTYYLSYSLNYMLSDARLDWSIARRPVSLTLDPSSALSKIYDGNNTFQFDSPDVEYDNQPDGTVDITWTYDLSETNEKENAYSSIVIYTIDNIISSDRNGISLPIISITAAIENVAVTSATIIFDAEVLDSNYIVTSDLSGIIINNEHLITPRAIRLVFDENASHVYNGETFSLSYSYSDGIYTGLDGLFGLQTPSGSPVSSLIGTNRIVGTANIGGETDADEYTISVSFTTKDNNNVTNYNMTVPAATYEIKQRELSISYTNTLQSLNGGAYSNIGYSIVHVNSDLTDLDWDGMGVNPETNLATLIANDSFSISIGSAWKSAPYAPYEEYTRIVGASNSSSMPVTKTSENYIINYPVLQITYLQITDAASYYFTVSSLADLLHLDSDNAGLKETYDDYEIGVLPRYTQTADIEGLVNGSYTVMPSIRSLRGQYVGGNHSISHVSIIPNTENAVGFFAKVVEGSVENLKLYDIGVYSTGAAISIGGFAGEIASGVTVTNVTLHVNMLAYANSGIGTISIGGFAGKSAGTLSSITVVGKANVYVIAFDSLYYGGVIGYANGGTATTISSFVDSSVVSEVSLSTKFYHGGIVGGMEEDWEEGLTSYKYLAYSNYQHDGSIAPTSANLRNSAFGTIAETDYGQNFDTLYADVTIKALLDTYVIRSYLFATGCNGTTAAPIEITNYRQIPLLLAYPYMTFYVSESIYSPIPWTTQKRGFYGTITYATGKEIQANVPSNVNLYDAIRTTNIVIQKEDE